jgi:hypothetical protein
MGRGRDKMGRGREWGKRGRGKGRELDGREEGREGGDMEGEKGDTIGGKGREDCWGRLRPLGRGNTYPYRPSCCYSKCMQQLLGKNLSNIHVAGPAVL